MKKGYKGFLLLLVLLTRITIANAQYENVWIFGDRAGIDFNTGSPVAVRDSIFSWEGSASVCGADGQLLFYTEGSKVWDRDHQLMPNGFDLALTPFLSPNTVTTSSTSQGAQIIPVPGEPDKYYIFSLTSIEFGNYAGRLYYSVLDMSLNGGMGDIISTQKGILLDSMLTEKMTAVTGDRCNIWLLVRATEPFIKAFEISASGIGTTPVISPASQYLYSWSSAGTMAVSPDRKKIAIGSNIQTSTPASNLALFDFDPVTGLLTNEMLVTSATLGVYGLCFSPDNSKLYGSFYNGTNLPMFQYDLSSGNPATIAAALTIYPFSSFTQLKQGPDGKIYFGRQGQIGRFESPNLPGMAAQLDSNVLTLLPSTSFKGGLPNPVPVIRRDTLYSSTHNTMHCFTETKTIKAADTTGWGYEWSMGANGTSFTTDIPGTYWVRYHTAPCSWHVDTFHLQTEHRLPQLLAAAGCYNESNAMAWAIAAAGDTATYTYIWQNAAGDTLRGPLQTDYGDTLLNIGNGTAYTLRILTPKGCDTLLSITTPEPDYQAAFSASDSIICMGATISFTNTSSGNFNNWHWIFGDGSGSSNVSPSHLFPEAGLYTVRLVATTPYPCNDTAYLTIAVDSILNSAFTTSKDSICTGEGISFTPQADNSVQGMHWDFGDETAFSTGSEAVQHAYDRDGVMAVQLSSHFRACPPTSYTDTVYVYPLPSVYLGPDQELCLNGNAVFLHNLQQPPDGTFHHTWSTGDTTAGIKVVHPGIFSLTVTAAPLGCSTTETVAVHKDCYVDIPNAFTPNGDGVNDYFFPRQLLSRGIASFRMQVFNRWGQIIFETTQTDGRGWDGRFNDKDQPQGVYVYLIDVSLKNGPAEHYNGNVTLIR